MRTAILGSLTVLVLAAALAGCKENEQSFYVEHMKAMPEPPDCEVSSGDPKSYGIMVDVAATRAYDYYGVFLVKNALVARENYDNLVAESNNIVFDGSEVVVTLPGGAGGVAEYRPIAQETLEPESSDVFPGISIPQSAFETMQTSLGCQSADDTAVQLASEIYGGGQVSTPDSWTIGTGYGSIVFYGHTQGDVEVETPEFSFAVNLCCNCFIDWSTCLNNPCDGFCYPGTNSSCDFGINDGISCSYWMSQLYNPDLTWTERRETELEDGGVGFEDVQVNCDTCTHSS